eukprot:6744557-Alexandrium_andersonii.AAC.1
MQAAPLLAAVGVDADPFRAWMVALERRGCARPDQLLSLCAQGPDPGPPLSEYHGLTAAQLEWVAGPLLPSLRSAVGAGPQVSTLWGPFLAPREQDEGPQLVEAARGLAVHLRSALLELAREGVPPGFRWSRVLSPLIWLSLPRYREALLRPTLREVGMEDSALFAVARLWEHDGVHEASQLGTWLRRRTAGLVAAAEQLQEE